MHRVNLAVREPKLHFFCYFFIYLFLFLFYLYIFLSANVVIKISPLKKKKKKKHFAFRVFFFFSEKCCYFTRSTEKYFLGSVFVCLFFCFSVCLLLFYFISLPALNVSRKAHFWRKMIFWKTIR